MYCNNSVISIRSYPGFTDINEKIRETSRNLINGTHTMYKMFYNDLFPMITEYGRDDQMYYSLMPNFLHHRSLRYSDKIKENVESKKEPGHEHVKCETEKILKN